MPQAAEAFVADVGVGSQASSGISCRSSGGTARDRGACRGIATIPLGDAEARLAQLADEVDGTRERVHITNDGREYVVLIPGAGLAGIEATLELFAAREAQEWIYRAEVELTGGGVVEEDELHTAGRTATP